MNVHLHWKLKKNKHATKEQCVSHLQRGLRLSCVCFQKYPAGLKYTPQHTWRKNTNTSKNWYEKIPTRMDWTKNISSIFKLELLLRLRLRVKHLTESFGIKISQFKLQATVRRTMIVSMSMIVNLKVESRKKACLTNTNPDTLAQVNSGTERGRECAGEWELDRWKCADGRRERGLEITALDSISVSG